ncbi:hypothetical protein PROFUN_03622 [Planoprotostelium fungivorum]|uniref:DNA polymerase epsilon catalytic subunit n=1 Tax=Planoprotostelium fungivorum TaxID=1890364 RepID=A0A2P6NSD3_9EUKA|nr:hypothetical protein PROFUN_03622 [Planoprotostelium fungivorum]
MSGGKFSTMEDNKKEKSLQISSRIDEIDSRFGFERYTQGKSRTGWLFTIRSSSIGDNESGDPIAALDMFFIQEDGSSFKASMPFEPYFYLSCKEVDHYTELEQYIRRKHDKHLTTVEIVQKEDLQLKNHLIGLKRTMMKVSFRTVQGLVAVRNELQPIIQKNRERALLQEVYVTEKKERKATDFLESLDDIREYDVRYYQRVAVDTGIRCGNWYDVNIEDGLPKLSLREDLLTRAEPRVLAFDIETTKLPLKFPDAEIDRIMMISYMLDGRGYLIVNREIVTEDIGDFEYTPKAEFEGIFQVFNEKDEFSLLRRFFDHIQEVKPNIYVTYNGDGFDWPFVDARARHHGLDLFQEIGVKQEEEEYKCRFGAHMDAFRWVKRDSYLPQGSQGLKAVTKAKLGYDPIEIDPELMLKYASTQPQDLAAYSVSDAVATYYLYMKYVHPFVFSLCTIIPMHPDDVLRKGSGTLCESLLEAEAYKANVIFPNKQGESMGKMYKGHLLESETYVGGHVEALESGVFRSDIPVNFELDPDTLQKLIDEVEDTLVFACEVEGNIPRRECTNFEKVKGQIVEALEELKRTPNRKEKPAIFHLDVGAMYPNIILTNRLQPTAVVSDEFCASCDYNKPENACQRTMTWTWKGDYMSANKQEYEMIKSQCESQRYPVPANWSKRNYGKIPKDIGFYQLPPDEQNEKIKTALKEYSKKVYKVTHKTHTEDRQSTNCMRENPFYVDCVRAFRDRRLVHKTNHKKATVALQKAEKEKKSQSELQDAEKLVVLYESLQLAHKCILNSFYGYVMRRGARWYSMEMAGEVTYTGSQIIKQARQLVERVGRPLELDTDGIWCILPNTFPQGFKFETAGRSFHFSYSCIVLNNNVAKNFTNEQYQTKREDGGYDARSECTIFFEIDGPYKAMILPAAKEEGKKLKKRYAVFDHHNKITELKGFEIKRRGELKLIKQFQGQIFGRFLDGTTLSECYASASSIANDYLDMLESKGGNADDEEILELLTESTNMSKKLEDYGKQKSCGITAAKRLAVLLGSETMKGKGVCCSYVISKKPEEYPVTERVVPTAIFSEEMDPATRRHFLNQWTKSSDSDLRSVLDWDYYKGRLSSVIQKIITIPATCQKLDNPVPRVAHPDWLLKQIKEKEGYHKQKRINDLFTVSTKDQVIRDLESIADGMSVAALKKRKLIEENNKDKENRKRGAINQQDEDTMDEYDLWLKKQKVVWKEQMKKRRENREKYGTSRRADTSGLGAYMEDNYVRLVQGNWDIVQIAETRKPGTFNVWVVVDGLLQSVKMKIPRTFYVNSYVSDDKNEKKVNLYLPRSKCRENLYEYSMDEEEFVRRKKEISEMCSSPDMEGVYEMRVPLLHRAVTVLGCQAATKKSQRSKVVSKKEFQLDDMEVVNAPGGSYLQRDVLKRIYLYHSQCDVREFLGIFIPGQKKVHVIMKTPYSKSQTSSVKRLLHSRLDDSYEISVECEEAENFVNKRADHFLSQYRSSTNGNNTCLIVQSVEGCTEISKNVPAMAMFPNLSIPFSSDDTEYNALGWETQAANLFLKRYELVDDWYNVQLEWSRFSKIPIGNLEEDLSIHCTDVLYARELRKSQHIQWYSENGMPDLGGSQEDDHSSAEEMIDTIVTEEGFYSGVCIEFELIGLPLNAILQSHLVNSMEATDELANQTIDFKKDPTATRTPHSLDINSCMKPFVMLKSLLSVISQGGLGDSIPAEILLAHCYRWLSTPDSHFYDPFMHRLVHNMIDKVSKQLVAEFRRMGAKVVHATSSRLIIATNKHTLEGAAAYRDFVLKTVREKELFNFVDIEPVQTWYNLFFLNRNNYSGMTVGENGISLECDAKWDVMSNIPTLVRGPMELIVTNYLSQCQKNTASSSESNDESQKDVLKKKNAKHFSSILFPRILELVDNVQKSTADQNRIDNGGSTAVECVKIMSRIFLLDKALQSEVYRLKKNLLKVTNVKEFTEESEKLEDYGTFDIPQVRCTFCNGISDLSLSLFEDEEEVNVQCHTCHNAYDLNELECRIVDMAMKKAVHYHTQDMVCIKCRAVKVDHMADICSSCSGRFHCQFGSQMTKRWV